MVMGRSKGRDFWCPVVSEPVRIKLTRPPGIQTVRYFVQCDQADCQYVDANKPPCPLNIGMFSDEISATEAEREARRKEEGR